MGKELPISDRRARWPILEAFILVIFPIPFKGPDALQSLYGYLPHLLQVLTPFLVGEFVTISSLRLTVRGVQTKRWGHAGTSAICTVLGVLSIILTLIVIRALAG